MMKMLVRLFFLFTLLIGTFEPTKQTNQIKAAAAAVAVKHCVHHLHIKFEASINQFTSSESHVLVSRCFYALITERQHCMPMRAPFNFIIFLRFINCFDKHRKK